MKAYLAIKYQADLSNRVLVEQLSTVLQDQGIQPFVMVLEDTGTTNDPVELMRKTFAAIDASDVVIVEFSEKGVGLGIEAGYAFARGKPIVVLARHGAMISETLRGIAKHVFFYHVPTDVADVIRGAF